jgi:Protein of unknown function (DUF429)
MHPARQILGVDFTSSPRPGKPITVAVCDWEGNALHMQALETLGSLEAFAELLNRPGPWVGSFDCPFGLPLEFIHEQGWQGDWAAVTRQLAALNRDELRTRCKAYCDARPPGQKFAHRATDGPAGSSPSMKWVNPPVVIMLHAAAPLLLDAGVHLPAHAVAGDAQRVALEAYPGYLARKVTRASYKSDTAAKQTVERKRERERIFAAITSVDSPAGLIAEVPAKLKKQLIDDPSGDSLDALLCALQAAAALNIPNFGLPCGIDPLEGWIVGVPEIAHGNPK